MVPPIKIADFMYIFIIFHIVPPMKNIDFHVLSEDYAPMKNIDFDGLFQDYTWGTPHEKKLFLCTFFKIMHRILHIDFVIRFFKFFHMVTPVLGIITYLKKHILSTLDNFTYGTPYNIKIEKKFQSLSII